MNNKDKKKDSPIVNFFAGLLLICIIIFAFYSCNKKDDSTDKTIEKSNKNYSIEVDSKTIIDTYYNNELDGNKKYFGKRIKTVGKYIEAEHGAITGWNVTFTTDGVYNFYCSSFVQGEENHFSEYNRYEPITIYATVDELVGGYLNLKECDLEKY